MKQVVNLTCRQRNLLKSIPDDGQWHDMPEGAWPHDIAVLRDKKLILTELLKDPSRRHTPIYNDHMSVRRARGWIA